MKHSVRQIPTGPATGRTAGFTLIEMMITVLVLAILGAIAVPIYEHQVQEAHRTDARTAVLELAAREERYYATNNAYTADPTSLGYGTAASPVTWPVDVTPNDYYSVSVTTPTTTTFTVTATAIGAQAADTECKTFSVDYTGSQTATGTGSNPSSTCWGH